GTDWERAGGQRESYRCNPALNAKHTGPIGIDRLLNCCLIRGLRDDEWTQRRHRRADCLCRGVFRGSHMNKTISVVVQNPRRIKSWTVKGREREAYGHGAGMTGCRIDFEGQ